MDFHIREKTWICFSCAYELKEGEAQGKSEEKSEIREFPAPQETRESSVPQDTQWQKKCPMCGGRMDFLSGEKIWMCYSCAYEEEGKAQGKSEEKSEHTNALKPTPVSEPIFDPSSPLADPLTSQSFNEDPIKGSIKDSSTSKNRSSTKKKTCPACHKKMNWHEDEKTWRCPFCEYERRVF